MTSKYQARRRVTGCIADALESRRLFSNMLVFTTTPAAATAGVSIDASTGGVQVAVETSGGQPVSGNTDTIAVSLGSNPGGATLGGTLTASAVNSVATFPNLFINTPATGYTLVATDVTTPGTTATNSPAFNINAGVVFSNLHDFSTSSVYLPGNLVMDQSGNFCRLRGDRIMPPCCSGVALELP